MICLSLSPFKIEFGSRIQERFVQDSLISFLCAYFTEMANYDKIVLKVSAKNQAEKMSLVCA